MISFQETRALGVQWSNLFKRADPSNQLTMGSIWIMFIVDMVVFGIVTWYIESVKPGRYGVARKWYFIFEVSYIRILLGGIEIQWGSEYYMAASTIIPGMRLMYSSDWIPAGRAYECCD